MQVLLDGFLHGSMLTLAVCTPKRDARLARRAANRGEPFRTVIVARRSNEQVAPMAEEETAREMATASR